jgi:hypothetical protein
MKPEFIQIYIDGFNFIVKPIVTANQLKALIGCNNPLYKIWIERPSKRLVSLKNYNIVDGFFEITGDEAIDLQTDRVRFFTTTSYLDVNPTSKNPPLKYSFLINKTEYMTNEEFLTGSMLKNISMLPSYYSVYKFINSTEQDKLIEDNEEIDLEQDRQFFICAIKTS